MEAQRIERGPARSFVFWGAAIGLAVAIVTAAASGRLLLDQEHTGATRPGALAWTCAFVAPFLVLLASLRLPALEQQRAIWLGCAGAILFLGLIGIFSGFGWVFLFVAGMVLWAWWATRQGQPSASSWRSPILSIWIILSFGAALRFLWLRNTARCWVPGVGWSAADAPNANSCVSDITDTTEGVLALIALAVGILGIALILRFWHSPVRPGHHLPTSRHRPLPE